MINVQAASKTEALKIALESVEVKPILGRELNSSSTVKLDLSMSNNELEQVDLTNTEEFAAFVTRMQGAHTTGIGGYAENRFVYKRSTMFSGKGKPRTLHLGVDLWGDAGTRVYAPLDGTVHSFAFNDRFGDYGATIVLKHEVNGVEFHTLYGHLSLDSLDGLAEGKAIAAGEAICSFGIPQENGHWPPHLHFQLIFDMQGHKGDYAGVAPMDEAEFYLGNCPDPNLLLRCPLLD